MSKRRILLLSCGLRKREEPAMAKDMYTGSLFRAARGYAERQDAPWLILSGKHGLLKPTTVITPYDQKLTPDQAPAWGVFVVESLIDLFSAEVETEFEIHAGRWYAGAIQKAEAWPAAWSITTPLAGKMLGQRMRWYKQQKVKLA